MPKVYRFRIYDIREDDYLSSNRMATKKKIKELGAMIIPDTGAKVYDDQVKDGMTEKNFDPKKPSGRP